MSLLSVKNLSFSYDGKQVLFPLSFDLGESDHAGVIGPNGAGKSTLLMLIAGLLVPSSGSVFIDGKDVLHLPAKERARLVAYLPQSSTQSELKGLTVRDLVLTGRFAYKGFFTGYTRLDHQKVDLVMEEMGLSAMQERDVSTLSGGEFQKVLLAGAVAQDAVVYLLDEAFSFLDVRYRAEMESLLAGLLKKRRIIISVFHHIDESLYNKNRILALKAGKLFFNDGLKRFISGNAAEKLYGVKFKKVKEGKRILLWPEMSL